jgi:hypothetical protein
MKTKNNIVVSTNHKIVFGSIHKVLTLLLISFLGFGMPLTSCGDSDNGTEIQTLGITGVSIPNPLLVQNGVPVTLSGKGFVVGDVLTFTSTDGTEYTTTISAVTESSMTFSLPSGFVSGSYYLSLTRNGEKVSLSKPAIQITVNLDIPDKAGMTVKGVVYCNGVGVAGVEVSDGIEVTTTDANGLYYLPSKKKYGYVFISVPGGYEVTNDGNAPQFFIRVNSDSPNTVEQANFSLTKVNNDKHALLALTDFHLAQRNADLTQFATFATDVNNTVTDLTKEGYRVYIMSMGDESWDAYWYENSFALPESYKQMLQLSAPTFHCMGNHDNDPYCADDWLAEKAWLRVCGPVYYSFNLGKVHYIVMDNIQYLNAGGSNGTIGERNYNKVVINEELEWLKKDLALISDKSQPVVVGMHAPLYDYPTLSGESQVDAYDMSGASSFISCFNGFGNVQILTGHTHVNYNVVASNTMMEHNTAAVCATWWWTGKLVGNHICCDGTPGGYGVYDFDGSNLSWYYKSAGYAKDYQFRTYDLNTTYINPSTYAPKYETDMTTYAHEYATPSTANEVLINVWNYDPQWKVEVSEGGTALKVTRVATYDPLHIISYDAQRIAGGGASKVSFPTEKTTHLFKVTASSATSTLTIKVTDRFGKTYTETMTRPKAFGYSMK